MDLVRFEPFRPGARAVVVTASGEQEIPLPDARYFRGRVAGDPNSIVLLVADPDTARGFVATGGTVYRFGRDRVGVHRVWNLRDADPVLHPHRGEFCANGDPAIAASLVAPNSTVRRVGGPTSPSASREAASAVPSAADGEPGTSAPAYAPLLSLDVAIETDQELLSLFGGNTTGATTYLSDLAAAVSAIYLADVGVTIRFSSIRLWGITDPWTATEVGSLLGQLQNYWIAQESSVSRDTVHMVSGRSPLAYGGIAYVNALCDGSYGYGVSTVYGSFNLLDPNDTYDAVVVAHELGGRGRRLLFRSRVGSGRRRDDHELLRSAARWRVEHQPDVRPGRERGDPPGRRGQRLRHHAVRQRYRRSGGGVRRRQPCRRRLLLVELHRRTRRQRLQRRQPVHIR
jgi:hypothetical protein